MIGVLLSLLAPFIFLILTPFNMCVVLWKHAKSRGFYKTINSYFLASARSIDCFGNVNLKPLFDACLIKKNGYKFGKVGETISSVLGKNQVKNTLTFVGWVIVYLLWGIDYKYWFNGGHCFNSID